MTLALHLRTVTASCWRRLWLAAAAVGTAIAIIVSATPAASAQESPVESLRAAVEHARASRDLAALALAHNTLGTHFWTNAEYADALLEYQAARALWTELDDAVGLGRVHNNIGAVHYQWGNLGLALESYQRSLAVRRALGDKRTIALVLTNVAAVHRSWGQFDRAQEAIDEAIRLSDEAGAPAERAYARHQLGWLRLDMGQPAEAGQAFEESLGIYLDPSHGLSPAQVRSGLGLNRHGLARIHLRRGDVRSAIAILEDLFGGDPLSARSGRQALPLADLGLAYLETGAPARALATLRHALALSEGAGQRPLTLDVLAALSRVHEARGELAEALSTERRRAELREALAGQAGAQEVAALEFRAEAQRRVEENLALRAEQRRQEIVISRQRLGVVLGGGLLLVSVALLTTLVHFNRLGRTRSQALASANRRLEERNQELQQALAEVRTLKGLIPICARCKKIRDEKGFWESVETYIAGRSDALFTHSICSACGPELYGDDWLGTSERQPPEEGAGAPASSP